MSAIWKTCDRCGGEYIAGMVGSTPWPQHVCPDGVKHASQLLRDGDIDGLVAIANSDAEAWAEEQAEAIRQQIANCPPPKGCVPKLED